LGCLLTEQQNPKTIGLSQMTQNDLHKAISTIKDLDIETINILLTKIDKLENMYQDVNETLITGGRVFVCGCGATGRLSIVLETLWRQETK
jgi:N-acetylmuramic acid 6-phosphate etherase